MDDDVAETTPTPIPTQDLANDPAVAIAALQEVFSTLVPPDRIHLQDAFGNEYSVRAVLPARAQITIMQHLQRLWETEVDGVAGLTSGGAAGVAGAVVALAADPVILNGLCDAFKAAHPSIVRKAKAKAAEEYAGDDDVPDLDDPANLFPVEELVAGLVPFFIRFAARAADLMRSMTAQPQPIAEA